MQYIEKSKRIAIRYLHSNTEFQMYFLHPVVFQYLAILLLTCLLWKIKFFDALNSDCKCNVTRDSIEW